MKRTAVSLPEEIIELVETERLRRDVSGSTVIRDACHHYFFESDLEPDLPFIGIVDGGGLPPHARDIDGFLERSWTDAIARRTPTPKSANSDRTKRAR